MIVPPTRTIALTSALAAGSALVIAWVSQSWIGLAPCALCLWERWPYRVAIALSVIAFILPARFRIAMLWLVVLTALAAATLAFVHVGVERGYWPSPLPECAAPHFTGGSIAERLASMPAKPAKPCDDPTYLIPGLPVSMAAMNLLYALAFSGLLAIYLLRNTGRRRRA